jgi:reactive intermediate/imine deaminase
MPQGLYSQAILAEGCRLLFISGQVPVDDQGQLVGHGDIEAQTRQVFRNLRLILESAGGTLADIVKWTIYDTDVVRHQAALRKVREEIFGGSYPASTKIEVQRLAEPGWLIEIDAIAVLA